MQHRLVLRIGERAEHALLGRARVGQEAERLVAVRRDHDLVVPPGRAVVGEDADAVGTPRDRAHAERRRGGVPPSRSAIRSTYVRLPPTTVRQRKRPKPSMPWLSKNLIAYAAGNSSARPGAVDQSAEVSGTMKWFAEPARVAALGEVTTECVRLVVVLLERAPRRPEPAADLGDERVEARPDEVPPLRVGPPARVLEAAGPARDRKGHVRLLRRDAELGEEPPEERVVGLVVDEEAGVEPEAPVRDRVRVAAGVVGALEDLHLVRARKQVGGSQAGDPGPDHGDSHQPLFAGRRIAVDG